MATITRSIDNEVLTYSEMTDLISVDGLWSYSRSETGAVGDYGQFFPIGTENDEKVFTLNFISADLMGDEQRAIQRFFSENSWYSIVAVEFGIEEPVRFRVKGVDDDFFKGSDQLTVTCRSEFADFVNVSNYVLLNFKLSSGATSRKRTVTYTNYSSKPATIELVLSADDSHYWDTDTEIVFRTGSRGLKFNIGSMTTLGVLSPHYGSKVSVNSSHEVVEGQAVINPVGSNFFKVQPGHSVTITVEPFANPVSAPLTVKLVEKIVENAAW